MVLEEGDLETLVEVLAQVPLVHVEGREGSSDLLLGVQVVPALLGGP